MASGLRLGTSFTLTGNAFEYANTMRVRAAALTKSCQQTGDEIGAIAMERALWWSDGPIKQKELTKMGHPYARRHVIVSRRATKSGKTRRSTVYARGKPGQNFPNRINRQSGDFYQGWNWSHVRKVGTGDMVGTLSNTSEHARWLTKYGTKHTIPRNVQTAINRDVRKQSQHLYGEILPRAIKAGRMRGSGSSMAAAFGRGFRRGLKAGAVLGGI